MKEHFNSIIIGSGFSGICAAIQLQKAGFTDFVILEKDALPGGTWAVNTYPGCACDIPSHLYSFSFEPKTDWSRAFPNQQEILDYINVCLDKYELRKKIQLNQQVISAHFDEKNYQWTVQTACGKTYTASYLITGTGGLSEAAIPEIKGMEQFKGAIFHSSRWNHAIDLKDKNVAVIGTGASAIQFVPRVVSGCKELQLYQRTAPWILPKPDRAYRGFEKWLFQHIPGWRYVYREFTYWTLELRAITFVLYPKLLKIASGKAKKYLKKNLQRADFIPKLSPDYVMGCKRILMSNDYYQSLNSERVSLVDEGIREIKANHIVTNDGSERKCDLIILATGFKATEYLAKIKITGLNGQTLSEAWQKGGRAYYGSTVAGFPNLFMCTGPNTGLGHNSMIHIIESQVNYIIKAIQYMQKNQKQSMHVKPEVQDAFNVALQQDLKRTVWQTGGCHSWYQDETGANPTLWPGFTFTFRNKLKKFDVENYLFE